MVVLLVIGFSGNVPRALAETGWYLQASPVTTTLRGVDFVDSLHGWICGDQGVILHTTNGGETWAQQSLGSTLRVNDIDFADMNTGYAVGELSTIWRTTNGGATWVMIRHFEQTPSYGSVFVLDPETVWITGSSDGGPAGNAATVIVSTNAGADWSGGSITHDHGTAGLDVAALSAQTAFIAVDVRRYDLSHYGLLFKTTDAAGSFQGVTVLSAPNQEVQYLNPMIGFYGPCWEGPEEGDLKSTVDGGANWTTRHIDNIYASHMSFVSADLGWITGYMGKIANTTDGGVTWVEQSTGIDDELLKIQFVNASVGTAVGVAGTILHTVTGGRSGADTPDTASQDPLILLRPEPNPFTGVVRLATVTPASGLDDIAIFDVSGRVVRVLTGLSLAGAGREIVWDGRDAFGRPAAPGMYYVRASCSGRTAQKSIALIR
jgi:photosystem II stability/assembly factor-like uncharacterized protein